ncbi:MAG: S8/S53 family peptidase [Phyllobacterium sp.]|uniref:S8/S53 family peptidase n=1 Tax=Phyllobacterium sp. TaxID=1871046 RepID=UPI0030F2929A
MEHRVVSGGVVELDNAHAIMAVLLTSLAAGYWSTIVYSPLKSERVDLRPLPKVGPISWWHKLAGVTSSDTRRGSGVTIGVIDAGLQLCADDPSLSHVQKLGDQKQYGVPADGLLPEASHGNAVTSLVFSRTVGSDGFQGLAPGAQGFFLSARLAASPIKVGLNPGMVANGIRELASKRDCDIISISAGDCSKPTTVVHDAVLDARDVGTLCFFASGNRGGAPLYPACYPEAISVAAMGRRGFAPHETVEARDDFQSLVNIGAEHYLWDGSATGANVKFIAGGSNTIWDYGGHAARAVSGTSFAAPVAAATAAVILAGTSKLWRSLPRSARRWDKMYEILVSNSRDVGLESEVVRHGLLTVP